MYVLLLGYGTTFEWDEYLAANKSIAAPESLFHQEVRI